MGSCAHSTCFCTVIGTDFFPSSPQRCLGYNNAPSWKLKSDTFLYEYAAEAAAPAMGGGGDLPPPACFRGNFTMERQFVFSETTTRRLLLFE